MVGKEQTARVRGKINNANFPQIRKHGKVALFLTSTSSERKFNPSAQNAQNWRAADNPGSDLFKETTNASGSLELSRPD